MNLYDGSQGLFDLLGRAYHALDVLLQAHGPGVPAAVEAFAAACDALANQLPIDQAFQGLPAATTTWQQQSAGLAGALRVACQNLVVELVRRDSPARARSPQEAWQYIIDQMLSGGYYVAQPATAYGVTAVSGNTGPSPSFLASLDDLGGYRLPLVIPESLDARAETATTLGLASGPPVDPLSGLWPTGSGVRQTALVYGGQESQVPNADFERVTNGLPADWTVTAGSPLISVVEPEQQTVTISGSPTGGWYALLYTDPEGRIWSTGPLNYNAAQAEVTRALREIPDLAEVTVLTTGTSPNFTHAITFEGLGGDVAQLASINALTGGTAPQITHATPRPGEPGSFRGRSLKITSDGATLPVLYAPVNVQAGQVYALHVWVRRSGSTPGGALRIALVDGLAGNVTSSPAGTSNALAVNAASVPEANHLGLGMAWRVRPEYAGTLWIEIRATSAWASGTAVYLDDLFLGPLLPLYTGGPYLGIFRPQRPVRPGDRWTLSFTNDRAGKVLEWTHRVFGLDQYNLSLPRAGTTLIPDSVIH